MLDWQTFIALSTLLTAVGAVAFGAIWKIFDSRLSQLERDVDDKVSQSQHDEFTRRIDQYIAQDYVTRHEMDSFRRELDKRGRE